VYRHFQLHRNPRPGGCHRGVLPAGRDTTVVGWPPRL